MNPASLSISILSFAILYLVIVYGLLTIAQLLRTKNNAVASNPKKNNQVKVP